MKRRRNIWNCFTKGDTRDASSSDGTRQRYTESRYVLLDFSLTVKAATLIFISGCDSAISAAKEGKSGFIYNLVKS